ncbi:MAG: FAD:protein FMN transferase [Oscillospiraceae bacterium]|nr:FAD:protein FMN transferase [Oscillospiraceae bacterium]
MKKVVCLLTVLALALSLSGCAKEARGQVYAMDTVMNFTVYGRGGEEVLASMERRVRELEDLLSRTREDSEISALNAAAGEERPVSPEVYTLLERARAAAEATGGAFDPTVAPVVSAWGFGGEAYRVPGEEELRALLNTVGYSGITLEEREGKYFASLRPGQSVDLGGIAKGYASDCMADILSGAGVKHALAALSGNILAWGAKTDGTPWRVGIRDPEQSDANVGVLLLQDAYAVTSGGYERYFEAGGKTYHHIIDPATGCPAESDLTSVTIVMDREQEELGSRAGNGTLCDALSTALFVMGEEEALAFWRGGTYDFDAVLVTADGRVVATEGLGERFIPTEGSGYAYETVS